MAVAQVTRKDLARQVSFTAELEPFQEIDVHAKVSGYIRDIKVDIGDQVKTGDILATLDVAEQQADLKKAEATFRQTTLDYDLIQSIMRRKPGCWHRTRWIRQSRLGEVAKAERDRAQVFADYSTIASAIQRHHYQTLLPIKARLYRRAPQATKAYCPPG